MDVRSARHIVALARYLSFTRAADELGISQSALSRSIQEFERSAEVRLFDRTRGGVHLTVLGKVITERAAGLIGEAEEIDRLLDRAARGGQDDIAFGVGPLAAKALLPQVMAAAIDGAAGLHSRIFARNSDALLALLLAEEIEFFICAEGLLPPSAPVSAFPIVACRTVHLVRHGHPLQSDPTRSAEDYPRIVSHRVTAPGGKTVQAGRAPMVFLEDLPACLSLLEKTDAIWMTSDLAAADELRQGRVVEISLPEVPNRSGSVRQMFYCMTGRSLSPAALRLRRLFRTAALQARNN